MFLMMAFPASPKLAIALMARCSHEYQLDSVKMGRESQMIDSLNIS